MRPVGARRRGAATIAALAVLATSGCTSGAGSETSSGASGGPSTPVEAPVAAVSGTFAYSGPDGHIWIVDARTGARRAVTRGDGGVDFDPHWSPDATRLVFRTERYHVPDPTSTGYMGIVVVDVATGVEHAVHPPGGGLFPAWSPDGTTIMFSSPRADGSEGLFTVRPDGSGLADLATYGEHVGWSPDGRSLLVDRQVGPPGHQNWEIWRAAADLSGLVPITDATGDDHFGAWSPDGRSIVFSTQRNDSGDVWLMAADGSGAHPLIERDGSQSAEGWIDGDRILFADNAATGAPRWSVVRPDGSALEAVAVLDGIDGPVGWTPRTVG